MNKIVYQYYSFLFAFVLIALFISYGAYIQNSNVLKSSGLECIVKKTCDKRILPGKDFNLNHQKFLDILYTSHLINTQLKIYQKKEYIFFHYTYTSDRKYSWILSLKNKNDIFYFNDFQGEDDFNTLQDCIKAI